MAPSSLHVAVAQPAVTLDDLVATVAAHAQAVTEAEADLVVFPEMSLTGYSFEAEPIDPDDARLIPLVDACGRAGSTALVGAPLRHDWGKAVGVLMVDPAGVSVAYLKMCPGSDELEHFIAGQEPEVIEVDGWRVGIGVCRDTRIADHLEATAELGMDLYVAGLVHKPSEVGEFDTRATQITTTYDVPVAFAGFAGDSGLIPETSGGSAIWSAQGEALARAGSAPGEVVSAVLSPTVG